MTTVSSISRWQRASRVSRLRRAAICVRTKCKSSPTTVPYMPRGSPRPTEWSTRNPSGTVWISSSPAWRNSASFWSFNLRISRLPIGREPKGSSMVLVSDSRRPPDKLTMTASIVWPAIFSAALTAASTTSCAASRFAIDPLCRPFDILWPIPMIFGWPDLSGRAIKQQTLDVPISRAAISPDLVLLRANCLL